MTHEVVNRYLSDVMKPQLASFGVPAALAENIAATVETQMMSCIHHWNDVPFRKALLIIGEEEGAFYYPRASADIRNFVVVTIRNSALETVHADSYQPSEKRLKPENIKAITSAAIEYFAKADLPVVSEQITAVENDIYGNLAKKHPVSWAALTELANSAKQVIECEYIETDVKPNLKNLKLQGAVNGLFFEETASQMMYVTADGYSLTIDHGLSLTLEKVIKNEVPYVSDSFKGVSRNIEKLLTIMEYVLCHDIAFITSNYLIANGYIERRIKPIKPGHDLKEMKRNWQNSNGLSKNHRGWLKMAFEGI